MSTYSLIIDGSPADDDLINAITELAIEENAELPGAIQLKVPVSTTDAGDLTYVADDRLRPFANIAVVATPDGGSPQCIFDGYVLSHKLHIETGTTSSTLEVWGQDASWLMNLEEKTHEWADVTDADVAGAVFANYGIEAAADNSNDDSPTHTEDGHTLMQRATDFQFLRTLARRNGKLCRVACADQPGQRTGYFAKPNFEGDPDVTLTLNDPQAYTVKALDIEWDVTRPTSVIARQALFTDSDSSGVSADTTDSGLPLLDQRGLADFSAQAITMMLTAPVDDAGELSLRAQSVLREAGNFVRCEGETDVSRLGAVLRVGSLASVVGVGSLHSGNYFVWSVQHTISHDNHKMKFVLVRNAIGPAPQSGGGGLPGGIGI